MLNAYILKIYGESRRGVDGDGASVDLLYCVGAAQLGTFFWSSSFVHDILF